MKINQGGNPSDVFAFAPTLTWTGEGTPVTAPFSLRGGEASRPFDVACNVERPGHVECATHFTNVVLRVTEQPTPGYVLRDIACRYTQSDDDANAYSAGPPGPTSPLKPASEVSTNLAAGTVDLKVHYNEWVLCAFTNAPVPAIAPLPPVTAPPVVAPAKAVSPAHMRPGSAKLASPQSCLTPNVVVARVTGRHIERVTFFVGGRRVKVLERPNRGAKWVLSKRVRGLPSHGPYRITARVQFTSASGTKAKTLTMLMGRCRSTASRPELTG